jgi:hypothetical protein
LKAWYTREGDQQEVSFDGFVVDIVRDELLIETRRANFLRSVPNCRFLVEQRAVHLIHPIPKEKWIVRLAGDNLTPYTPKIAETRPDRRPVHRLGPHSRSITHPNFTLDVLFTHEEEIWRDDHRAALAA